MKIKCPHCGNDIELKRSLSGYDKHGLNFFSEIAKKSVLARKAKMGEDVMAVARAKRWPKKETT